MIPPLALGAVATTLLMARFLALLLAGRTPLRPGARRRPCPWWVHAGMIEILAESAARLAGGAWPVLTPFAGVMGTFVTGSATSSNILFTDFQQATAMQTEVPVLRALGAQGFGAAAGNMIAPMNVLAGAATVGLVGREGEVLRRTLPVCLIYTLMGGALAWLLAGLS